MSKQFKLEGLGLQGLPDLGIIRYIPTLEPLCQFIDRVLRAEDYEVDITAVSLRDTDVSQLGHDLIHTAVNVDMVERFYNELSGMEKKELLDAIKSIADEFRHFRFSSYMDDSVTDRDIGGPEVAQIYTDLYAVHKTIKREGKDGIVEALSKFVLAYVYEWHGENVRELFMESMNYFETTLLSKILFITLTHENMLTFPRYRIVIEVEETNG